MLTLIFLRFIGEKFEDGVARLKEKLKDQGLDPEMPEIHKVFLTTLPLRTVLTICLWMPAGEP